MQDKIIKKIDTIIKDLNMLKKELYSQKKKKKQFKQDDGSIFVKGVGWTQDYTSVRRRKKGLGSNEV